MSEVFSFTDLARDVFRCGHDATARLFVAVAWCVLVWLLRGVLCAKAIQSWRRGGAVARWLRTDRGTIVLMLAGSIVAALLTAWCARVSVTVRLIGTGAINGLLAVGIWAVARAFGLRGLWAPPDPPGGGPVIQENTPPFATGLLSPPGAPPKPTYQA
jgi:hypothetical protein